MSDKPSDLWVYCSNWIIYIAFFYNMMPFSVRISVKGHVTLDLGLFFAFRVKKCSYVLILMKECVLIQNR